MKIDTAQEAIFSSTLRITKKGKSDLGTSIGTGFIFEASIDDIRKQFVLFLVSNRHVFGNSFETISFNFHKAKDDYSGPDLGKVVVFESEALPHHEHPDQNVDLACINITGAEFGAPGNSVYYKHLTDKLVSDFTEDDLLPGKEVWFVGYPENRFDVIHNLPILRKGYIASMPKIDFNARKEFVIDAQVFPGSSGSPVFAVLNGKFKLIGIIAKTMIRNQELETLPAGFNLGIQQIIGLGIVIKATAFKELVECAVKEYKLRIEEKERLRMTRK